jgi:hypothetical protein
VSVDLKASGFEGFCIHWNCCVGNRDFAIPDRAHTYHRESGYRRSREREFYTLQNHETRFPDEPRDKGAHSRVNIGQVADCIAYRDIASFVDKESMRYEITNPENPT